MRFPLVVTRSSHVERVGAGKRTAGPTLPDAALAHQSVVITEGSEPVTPVDRVTAMMALRREAASVGRSHDPMAAVRTVVRKGPVR